MSGRPAKRRKKPALWKYRILRDGTVAIMRYRGKEQDVVVPAEIDGRTVTVIEGLTIVGKDDEFDEYKHELNTTIHSVTLPDTVVEIGKRAFGGCDHLETINLPDSLEVIDTYAFVACDRLEKPELPSSLTYIGNAFEGCTKMADKDGFVILGDVLYDYYGTAAEVVIPEGVRKIEYAAYNSDIVSVKLPDTVTEISPAAFWNCKNLKSINIPQRLCQVGQSAFRGCCGLADENGFVIVNGVLYDYIGEKTQITVPDGVTEISANALDRRSITSIELPDTVKSISPFAFGYQNSGFSEFFIIDGVLHCYRGGESEIVIPEGVKEIGKRVFTGHGEIESVKLPDSLKKIGAGAFDKCRQLENINLNADVETDDTAFTDCDGLADENGFVILNGILFDYLRKKTPSLITVPDSVNIIGKKLTGQNEPGFPPIPDEHPFWQCRVIRAKKDSVIRKYAEEKGIAFRVPRKKKTV